ncbi:MAG: DEAD/DEAH box helicase family protein [Clostridia bacterium]|nr:DEAD/DEAH box helicase family protein [Clostridia bacterium]
MEDKKIVKPDVKLAKELINEASAIDAKLYALRDSERQQRREAQSFATKLYEERINEMLRNMDVDHVNKSKQGIRVSLLRDAGFDNVLQLSQASYQKICSIQGIGEQSARKIVDTVKQIIENTKKTARIRIQIEEPSKVDDDLIRALYVLINTRPLRSDCEALYKANHGVLQQELKIAKKATGFLSWLFASKMQKQNIVSAIESLESRINNVYYGDPSFAKLIEIEKADEFTCRADYRNNAPSYYSELEQLGLNWEKEEKAPGGLPAELAAEIEAQKLDLSLLKATLRSYQTFGAKYIIHQKKTLLGDEMGLGKTVQAIASMVALAAEGKSHFIVVCPASVLINWYREIQKFSELEAVKVHGNDEEALLHWRQNGGVMVTTFESISRFELPEKFRVSMVVVDEAHYVKNPETQRTKALVKLLKKTEYTLFMSGTPLENRVEEMCFLISCLQPEVAKSLEEVKFLSTAEQFRLQLAPVYLRRTRDDVLQELPDLIEKEQWCILGAEEQKVYKDAVLSENFMAIRQVSWHVDNLAHSSKAARLLELCDQAREQGRKVIVFSFFRNTMQRVAELLGDRCMEPITGAISPQRRQEIVDEFSKADDGAVLLSQVQAGGTGLNIQSASVIIFCEPQIKPSIENQAIARAYRMGQVRDVLVYRLLGDDTVDEKIMELLKNKQLQFDSFADESVVGEESLKPQESEWMSKLVEEEKKRLQALE